MTLETRSTISSHDLRTSSRNLESPTVTSVVVSSIVQVMDPTKNLYMIGIISTLNAETTTEFTVINSFPKTTALPKTVDVTITSFPKTTDVSNTDTLQGTTYVISPSLDTNDVPIPTPTPTTIDVTLSNTMPEFPLSDLPTTSSTSICQIISTKIEQSPAVKSIPPSIATVSTMIHQEPQLSQPTQEIMSTQLVTTFERELQQSRANEVSKMRFSTFILILYIYFANDMLCFL